jgi:hypothetical protein
MRKFISRVALILIAISAFVFALESCKPEEPPVFDAPSIAVVADNSNPYPGDKVIFTIQVSALGKLNEVTANGAVIKTYVADELESSFTYEYTVPANSTLGPTAINFKVTDKQAASKMTESSSTLTIQNPVLRGNPLVIDRMDATYPAGLIKDYFAEGPVEGWAYTGELEKNSTDPKNSANKVIKWTKNAFNWIWQGNDFFNGELSKALSESDMLDVFNGKRVIQINVYFEHVPHATETRFDWPSSGGTVPINIQLGKKSLWGWDNGDKGRKMYLRATATDAKNKWQTITFSVEEDLANPGKPYDANPTIGFDQIDRFMILPNPNQRDPKDTNIWRFDNLRIIDKAEKDKNPNM